MKKSIVAECKLQETDGKAYQGTTKICDAVIHTLLPSAHHKILDIPPEIPYTKQCAAGEIAVPCTRNPLQRG